MDKKIYLIILLLVIVALVCLPLVKVPISSSSRGVFRSIKENTKITSVIHGKVVKSKLTRNNQWVKKGDTLLVVTADQLETQKELQRNQLSDYKSQLQDLIHLTQGKYTELQTGQYQKEFITLQEKLRQADTKLALSKQNLDREHILYQQGVIPKAEYDKYDYEYQDLATQVEVIKQQQLAQWQSQKRELERQVRSIGSDIQRINQDQNNYSITAPVSGRLVRFSGVQIGNFIIQGQDIGEISPEESLVVECLVSPKDIGFIYLNQTVRFQIDTYNYNQWGVLEGGVIEIDQNIIVNQQTGDTYFRVLCTTDRDYLQLKNGYKGHIAKGMTLTAKFHLTDRTLWQLLFDRVDDWLNPKLRS